MMEQILKTIDTLDLLNKVDENILIANSDHILVWVNASAKILLAKIGPYVGINSAEEFIGKKITSFHGSGPQEVLDHGPFPHSAHITMFNKFTADILVDELLDENGVRKGYILTWKDVTEYEDKMIETQQLIEEIDTPIIPTVMNNTVLIPVMGKLTYDRMELIKTKTLFHCAENRIEYVVFDFTSLSQKIEPEEIIGIEQVIKALALMGAKAICVGISSGMAQSLIEKNMKLDVPMFQSFRQGILYLFKKNGFELVKQQK